MSAHKSLVRLLLPLAAVSLLLTACAGPRAVRGEEVPGLNDEAMSTGLDQRDLQKLLHQNMEALQHSAVIRRWESENRPTVAVLPFRNDTTEHIDSQLDALISDIQTVLVNAGHVRVVDVQRQPQLIEEVRSQYGDAFDPSKVARWGRQVGARYFVTGKVYSADERQDEERRVQYFMFVQVLDAETSDILFQNKTSLTKAIVK